MKVLLAMLQALPLPTLVKLFSMLPEIARAADEASHIIGIELHRINIVLNGVSKQHHGNHVAAARWIHAIEPGSEEEKRFFAHGDQAMHP